MLIYACMFVLQKAKQFFILKINIIVTDYLQKNEIASIPLY